MPGTFVLKKSSGGLPLNLQASNGRLIASSEHYESRAAALRGVESIRKNAAGAKLVDEDADAATPARRTAKQATGKKSAAKRAAKGT